MLSTSDGQTIALGMARRGKARMRRGVLYHTPRDYGVLGIFADGTPGILGDYRSPGLSFFTDALGEVPALPGDPVQFVRDTSGRGNHRVQATAAARPTLTRWPKSGRRNVLDRSQEFGNSYWFKVSSTVSPNAAIAPDGTLTADKIIRNNGETTGWISRGSLPYMPSTQYTLSAHFKAAERNVAALDFSSPETGDIRLIINLDTLGDILFNGDSYSIAPLANGWFRVSLTLTTAASVTSGNFRIGRVDYLGDGVQGIYVWGAQLERGAAATAYQSAVSQYDITEDGQPSCYGLWYDGVDDRLVTQGNVDFSGGDHITAIMGLTKLADAANAGALNHNSTSADGGFMLQAPTSAVAQNYRWRQNLSSGFAQVNAVRPAPTSNVVTGQSDVSLSVHSLRVDGVLEATQTLAPATPLTNSGVTTGSLTGGNFPFSGIEWGLLLAGKQLSPSVLAQSEDVIAANTPEVTL